MCQNKELLALKSFLENLFIGECVSISFKTMKNLLEFEGLEKLTSDQYETFLNKSIKLGYIQIIVFNEIYFQVTKIGKRWLKEKNCEY